MHVAIQQTGGTICLTTFWKVPLASIVTSQSTLCTLKILTKINFCRFLRWTEIVVSSIKEILVDITGAHVVSSCQRKCAMC